MMGSTGLHSTWFSEQVKILRMSVLAFSRFPGDQAALNRAILSLAALTALQTEKQDQKNEKIKNCSTSKQEDPFKLFIFYYQYLLILNLS